MTSPHRHSPLTSLAWSHCATTPFRIHERRPCRHTTVRKDAGGRDLDDAVVSWPDAGGFQVQAHQRPSQDQVGGKLLCEALYVHRSTLRFVAASGPATSVRYQHRSRLPQVGRCDAFIGEWSLMFRVRREDYHHRSTVRKQAFRLPGQLAPRVHRAAAASRDLALRVPRTSMPSWSTTTGSMKALPRDHGGCRRTSRFLAANPLATYDRPYRSVASDRLRRTLRGWCA